ncbi:replicative DNA helicase [Priestia flexa]|uniref:replicative DNA helicase n=1 Tax=Priestia flexa TaxID=86664 RepID=UPI001F35A4E3|nr:replicative DNA helicase [Priestia flexa]
MIQMILPTSQTYSLEAETSVLGAVLYDPDIIDGVVPKLEERDFYNAAHRHIWNGILNLYRKNKPIDVVTVSEQLNQKGILQDVGGVSYLTQLADSVPTTANTIYYCDLVKSKALRRRGIEAAEKIRYLSEEQEFEDDETFLTEVENQALKIRPKVSGNLKHLSESRYDYLEYLLEKDDFIYTGFKRFDKWMGGIGRGWLYILAARPSVGKTAKAIQMGLGIAKQGIGNVLFFSQEMTRNQLFNRMISSLTLIPANKIRRKELSVEELGEVEDAFKKLENLPLFIEDASNISIHEVRSKANQIRRKYGDLSAIIVDYLTIMNIPQSPGQTRSHAVGEVTRTAKKIAIELNVPFIMLAQLSREGAKSLEPRLDHLRDSGEIEQDADVVELLWHDPNDYHREGKVIQSIIAKGRDVGINKFRYLFKGWCQKFEEPEG